MKKMLIVGNWKMNKTPREAIELARTLQQGLENYDLSQVSVVIAPPNVALWPVMETLRGSNDRLLLGAQNIHYEASGAFTGEVSAPMLVDTGVRYVILGHSERRQHFGEHSLLINAKLKMTLKHGLQPILCIGENLAERDRVQEVLLEQLIEGLSGINEAEMTQLAIAYEPVWAIGTGYTAEPEWVKHIHLFLRQFLTERFSGQTAQRVKLLYGGSVQAGNSRALLGLANVDGALIGGASLKTAEFLAIVATATELV